MNKLTEVPAGVGKLQVVELNLNQNQVCTWLIFISLKGFLPIVSIVLQIQLMSDEVAQCQRLKTLRIEENCLQMISPTVLKESSISLLAFEGNLFDSKDLMKADGYAQYMARYSASKK